MDSRSDQYITIAIDIMGGDHSVAHNVSAANLSLKIIPNGDLRLLMFGDANLIHLELSKYPKLKQITQVVHCEDVIESGEPVAQSLRKRAKTSMWMAISAVKKQEADAIVSSGNTGALMAMSKLSLGSIEGISRPAIVTQFPTDNMGQVTMLDLGANAEVTPDQLHQFAIMGSAYSSVLSNKPEPRVALLNIGSEDIKGNSTVKEAANILSRDTSLNYKGFAEGDKIFQGNFDVIVTDGFSGNILLKTTEGTVKYLARIFKKNVYKPIFNRVILYIFMLPALLLIMPSIIKMLKTVDPRVYNGAMLIGLNGISIKSHGGADKKSISYAIRAAYNLSKNKVNSKIIENIKNNSAKNEI